MGLGWALHSCHAVLVSRGRVLVQPYDLVSLRCKLDIIITDFDPHKLVQYYLVVAANTHTQFPS